MPDRLADLRGPREGEGALPLHVRCSDPARTYDVSRRADRIAVYEQVLEEGNVSDICALVHLRSLSRCSTTSTCRPHTRRLASAAPS
jgi:hypothetical protein